MKYSKKILALVLTTAFSLNTVSVVDAAPTRDQIEALRAEIKELTEVLKVEKAKHKYEKQQAERSGNNALLKPNSTLLFCQGDTVWLVGDKLKINQLK